MLSRAPRWPARGSDWVLGVYAQAKRARPALELSGPWHPQRIPQRSRAPGSRKRRAEPLDDVWLGSDLGSWCQGEARGPQSQQLVPANGLRVVVYRRIIICGANLACQDEIGGAGPSSGL